VVAEIEKERGHMDSKNNLQEMVSGSREMQAIFGGGVNNAVIGLSQMAGQEIKIVELNLKKVLVKDIPAMFGGPEALIIAVYLEISGTSNGHMVVVYEPKIAFDLVDMLLGQPAGTSKELSDMERSTLGEMGNIMGSFFLNYISDSTGARFQPSPPAVMMDMAGAILDAALANVLAFSESTYIVETVFGTNDRQVSGTFLVIPDPELEGL
jgi:chemotaxis protein CheC